MLATTDKSLACRFPLKVAMLLTEMYGTNISRSVKDMIRNRGKIVSDSPNKRKRRSEVSLEER